METAAKRLVPPGMGNPYAAAAAVLPKQGRIQASASFEKDLYTLSVSKHAIVSPV